MKKIEVTVPPFKVEEMRDALVAAGAEGMSITEVKVLDEHVRTASYRGTTFEIPFSARCKVELVVRDDQVGRCLEAVRAHAGAQAGRRSSC